MPPPPLLLVTPGWLCPEAAAGGWVVLARGGRPGEPEGGRMVEAAALGVAGRPLPPMLLLVVATMGGICRRRKERRWTVR